MIRGRFQPGRLVALALALLAIRSCDLSGQALSLLPSEVAVAERLAFTSEIGLCIAAVWSWPAEAEAQSPDWNPPGGLRSRDGRYRYTPLRPTPLPLPDGETDFAWRTLSSLACDGGGLGAEVIALIEATWSQDGAYYAWSDGENLLLLLAPRQQKVFLLGGA